MIDVRLEQRNRVWSAARLAIAVLFCLLLTVACDRTFDEVARLASGNREMIVFIFQLLALSYGSFIVTIARLVGAVIFRKELSPKPNLCEIGAFLGVFPALVLQYSIVTWGQFLARAMMTIAVVIYEIVSFPGKPLLILFGRPMALQDDHFEIWFEKAQMFAFFPLNALSWIVLLAIAGLFGSFLRMRFPLASRVAFYLMVIFLGCGFLSLRFCWELSVTVDLVLSVSKWLISLVTLGVVVAGQPGVVSAAPYWVLATVCALAAFRFARRQQRADVSVPLRID
ncbi:MAG: hypothetical protein HC897_03775 [Thermoanaerobaculia bacterium]|nr:hypothetical protein [Thermoanaerobaculia bacterium]